MDFFLERPTKIMCKTLCMWAFSSPQRSLLKLKRIRARRRKNRWGKKQTNKKKTPQKNHQKNLARILIEIVLTWEELKSVLYIETSNSWTGYVFPLIEILFGSFHFVDFSTQVLYKFCYIYNMFHFYEQL